MQTGIIGIMESKAYTGRTVLITGGAGFIGSALAKTLSAVSCRIVVLLRPGRKWTAVPNAHAEMQAIHGDTLNPQTWQRALEGVDYVFHMAGQTSGYVANQDPLTDLEANVVPVLQMLEACRLKGLKPAILFSGTVTQVGLPKQLPVDESEPDFPIMVYDIHKLAAEKYLQYYAGAFGIPTVTLRLSNVYGPGVNVGSGDRGVLNRMMVNALGNKPLTVYGDGAQIRDYIFIDDVVSAFLTAGTCAPTLSGNYYVIGSGQPFRIVDAINLVADRAQLALGRRPAVTHIIPPKSQAPIERRDFIANTSKFRAATGWRPRVLLIEGIDSTIEHLLTRCQASPTGSP